ncbi:hypothetical protein [Mesorhizobium sp.]|uniref:hypothetical protein n=1 Tax=Mesorhizobium sp. TaxID=1871066 RepID=UPI0025F075E9|nr:hypothetical protein [Mesorhizobium sp.]
MAEFVDARTGKRYLPGDGNNIDPPLTEEQFERLKKSGCLKDGTESSGSTAAISDKSPLEVMTVAELQQLAAYNKIDLGDAKKKPDLITAIEAALAAKNLRVNGPTIGEFVAAGYKASAYPPGGYALKSSQDEIDAAIAAEKAQST